MAAIDSAYQYYLSTYGNSTVSRYDTHKKSQLRDTYNKIVKTNKESPLYKIKNLEEAKKYAIDIKESVGDIQHIVASLSGSDQGIEKVFSKKIAQSSDEDVVTAEYIGNDDTPDTTSFHIAVKQLATEQINQGNYLQPDRYQFTPGIYSFDLNTNTNSYEFQFSVDRKDSNADVQQKLMQLINHSKIGINASMVQNGKGENALVLSSSQTGIADDEDYLFQILPDASPSSMHAIKLLGINQIAQEAGNSSFVLNGKEHSSYSNSFMVNNQFNLTLNGISKDGSEATIDFKTDADAVADNVSRLANAYNEVIRIGHSYSDAQRPNKLVSDMSSVAKDYRNELEAMGLELDADNYLHIDRSLLYDAATAEDAQDNFSILNQFKDTLNSKAAEASIDPMNYVNKIIVAYKNPGHNFATPYITSIYSGMMLDRYC